MPSARLGLLLLVACGAAPGPPPPAAPLAWSPDGRWLAYTQELSSSSRKVVALDVLSGDRQPADVGSARTFRLWAYRLEDGESALLAESPEPLGSPSWSPDGTAVAYARTGSTDDGRRALEWIVQDGLEHQRVAASVPVEVPPPPGLQATWSPDGKSILVPSQDRPGLDVIRLADGHTVRRFEGALKPAWSPDGLKLAFFRQGTPDGLFWTDAAFGEPRRVREVAEIERIPPPVWSRDGQTIGFLKRSPMPANAGGRSMYRTQLVRAEATGARTENGALLSQGQAPEYESFRGSWWSADADGDEFFYAALSEGHPSQVAWVRPRTGEVRRRFNPVDPGVQVSEVAISPVGRILAMRLGSPGVAASVAVYDVESDKLTPLVPDGATRARWAERLLEVMGRALSDWPAKAGVDGAEIVRPVPLPAPGESEDDSPVANRLKRLSRLGRTFCDGPDAEGLAQARLVFDYLSDDFEAAQADLDAIEASATGRTSLDGRAALILRAQIALGRKDPEQAADTIDYLKRLPEGAVESVEETPGGYAIHEQAGALGPWLTFLDSLRDGLTHPHADSEESEGPIRYGQMPDAKPARPAALPDRAPQRQVRPGPRPRRPNAPF